MASAPSPSALSAVLRSRAPLLGRNPPAARPAAPAQGGRAPRGPAVRRWVLRDAVPAVPGLPSGQLRLRVLEVAGASPALPAPPAWTTLKCACVSLGSLVSRLVLLKLLLQGFARGSAHAPPLLQRGGARDALQSDGQIHSSSRDTLSSGREMTQDRPD